MSTNKQDFPITIGWAITTALAVLAVAALLFMCTGCYSTRKAQFQVSKAQVLRPAVVAKICADLYPVRVVDSSRIEFREGETIYRHDTVETMVNCDSIVAMARNSHGSIAGHGKTMVRIPCPPCPVRVDTIVDTRFRQIENTARVSQLTSELQKERDARIKAESGRGMWRMWALILIAYTIVRIVLRVWLRISLP